MATWYRNYVTTRHFVRVSPA